MIDELNGLHHVTSLASDAARTDRFFTGTLGLRRVKKTVNFDAPDVYHLYYGDEIGTPGTAMTYFPFPQAARGRPGTGEVGTTRFSIPRGSADAWADRLAQAGAAGLGAADLFGDTALAFQGPDGDAFALVEGDDNRAPWTGGGVGAEMAIRGFHSVALRLAETTATAELLRVMGYEEAGAEGSFTRFALQGGGPARIVDLQHAPGTPPARQGAGSVHHVAFSVADRARQLEVQRALAEYGMQVTPVIDRDYFWSVYFRTPGGVLFEIATDEPGFDRDEDRAHLGEALKLPAQHEHLRGRLEAHLQPIGG